DADGDGIPNAMEYLMGSDANDAGSASAVAESIVIVNGVEHLAMTYEENTSITDLALVPEFSAALSFNQTIEALEVETVNLGSDTARITVRSSAPIGAGSQFGRVTISTIL